MNQPDHLANCRQMNAELIEVKNAEVQSWIEDHLSGEGWYKQRYGIQSRSESFNSICLCLMLWA